MHSQSGNSFRQESMSILINDVAFNEGKGQKQLVHVPDLAISGEPNLTLKAFSLGLNDRNPDLKSK